MRNSADDNNEYPVTDLSSSSDRTQRARGVMFLRVVSILCTFVNPRSA